MTEFPDRGVHTMDATTYHNDPCAGPSLSASIAHTLITQSPRHAWANHPRLNPAFQRDYDEKFDVGVAAHAWILEGRDAVGVVEAPDWRTKDAKAMRDEFRAQGRIPLLGKHYDELVRMVDAVAKQLRENDVTPVPFTEGKPEQTLVWSEGGVACRARLDWLRDDRTVIDDLKTTGRSANPEAWTRSTLWSIGADIQAAFYLRGLRATTGADAEFRWTVVETAPPYALCVVSLAPGALDLANDKVEYAIRRWAECLETGEWPSYPTRVCYADAPSWEETRWLEREAREEAA